MSFLFDSLRYRHTFPVVFTENFLQVSAHADLATTWQQNTFFLQVFPDRTGLNIVAIGSVEADTNIEIGHAFNLPHVASPFNLMCGAIGCTVFLFRHLDSKQKRLLIALSVKSENGSCPDTRLLWDISFVKRFRESGDFMKHLLLLLAALVAGAIDITYWSENLAFL